jgi:hypothetical protein
MTIRLKHIFGVEEMMLPKLRLLWKQCSFSAPSQVKKAIPVTGHEGP